ncbi:MAG: hypothetical protein M3400_04965 [Actinomycetota bacterium]|nr:hypothetical protein [Actinomycetota bacterium]
MLGKLAKTIAITAMAAGSVLLSAGTASAAHCTGVTAEEMAQPGFSYFGTDHVQETDHNGDAPGSPEGRGQHDPTGANAPLGNPGASNCVETTGSPSERAPGQNR